MCIDLGECTDSDSDCSWANFSPITSSDESNLSCFDDPNCFTSDSDSSKEDSCSKLIDSQLPPVRESLSETGIHIQ